MDNGFNFPFWSLLSLLPPLSKLILFSLNRVCGLINYFSNVFFLSVIGEREYSFFTNLFGWTRAVIKEDEFWTNSLSFALIASLSFSKATLSFSFDCFVSISRFLELGNYFCDEVLYLSSTTFYPLWFYDFVDLSCDSLLTAFAIASCAFLNSCRFSINRTLNSLIYLLQIDCAF